MPTVRIYATAAMTGYAQITGYGSGYGAWTTMYNANGNDSGSGTEGIYSKSQVWATRVAPGYYLSGVNAWDALARGIIGFNTSSLTSTATIFSVKLGIHIHSKSNSSLNLSPAPSMCLYSQSQAGIGNPCFQGAGEVELSDTISFASVTADTYKEFTLNATGIATINKTGNTWLSIREPYWDVAHNVPPNPAQYKTESSILYHTATESDAVRPYLEIVYVTDGTKILELAFNQSIFTDRDSLTWTDVSSDLMKLNVKRGRMHELDRIEAGTASFTLSNTSGNWWRYNTSGSHFGTFGDVKPLTPIRLRVTYNGTTYNKFYGMVESIKHSWLGEKGYAPVAEISCVDIFKSLARFPIGDDDPDNVDYPTELSGERVTLVLANFGWPVGMRDLDAGEVFVMPYAPKSASERENALEHLQRVAEAENGIIFVAGNGDITFQDSLARQIAPLNTSQATFTDVGTDSKYVEPDLVDDDTFIYNEISISGEGLGAEIVTKILDVQASQGVRRLTRSNSLMTDPLTAWEQGYVFTRRYADSILRVDSLIIKPDASPADLYPKVLGYEISTRITVVLNSTENPALLNTKYHIEGIEDDWEVDGQWVTKWQLWDVNQYYSLKASHTDSVYARGIVANYAVVQAQAAGDATRPDTDTNYVSNWTYVPGECEIERTVFYFDLSGIIASSVTSARLYFYVADKSAPAVDFSLSVVAGIGVSRPLVVNDYGLLGDANTILGSIANSATTIGTYNYIDLNAAGLAYVMACTGGICELALRMNNDINAVPTSDNKQNIVGLTGGAIPKIIIGVEL